jgi:Methyltransferase FkbM domain
LLPEHNRPTDIDECKPAGDDQEWRADNKDNGRGDEIDDIFPFKVRRHYRGRRHADGRLLDSCCGPIVEPEPGTQPLYKDRDISGLASLSKRRLEHFNVRMDQIEMVTISTIDTIVAEISLSAIDLLKLDVEGHEFSVLRGATKAMERGIIKLVQFEFGGCNLDTRINLQDFYYFFKSFNFVIGLVQPGGGIQLLEQYDEFYEQYRTTNFVAAPRATLVG